MSAEVQAASAEGAETPGRFRIDRSFLTPSRRHGYVQVLSNIGLFAALLVLAGRSNALWQHVLLILAIGCVQHRLFFPVHDCIHYSLFPSKRENWLFGNLCSAMIGTSFDAIRIQHMAHHKDFGSEKDPGASDYFVRFRSRWELLAFLLGPLAGSILFQKALDYASRPALAKGKTSAAGNAASRAMPYLVILLVQAAICAILSQGFQWGELWRYPVFYLLPLVTVFLFFNRLRMFLEHGSLDYAVCDYFEGRRPTARTIYASRLEQLLVVGGDFNYHHEHHLYPVVPGWRLRDLHRKMLSRLEPEDIRQTYAQALVEIWRNLPWSRPAAA